MSDIQIPELVAGQWEVEKQTLHEFIRPFEEGTTTFEERVVFVEELYAYLHTLPDLFFDEHPRLRLAVVEKAIQFIAEPALEHIHELLYTTVERLE